MNIINNVNAQQKIHRGFSLIELMVVVAIIGVLSAVAVPSYTSHGTVGLWREYGTSKLIGIHLTPTVVDGVVSWTCSSSKIAYEFVPVACQ